MTAFQQFPASLWMVLFLMISIEKEIKKNTDFAEMKGLIEEKGYSYSAGFRYAKNLFYCALLMYYDKFHNFDVMAVKKLFTWSFMIRVDMEKLGFDSIKYEYVIYGHERRLRIVGF